MLLGVVRVFTVSLIKLVLFGIEALSDHPSVAGKA